MTYGTIQPHPALADRGWGTQATTTQGREMHYYAIALLPPGTSDVDAELERLMAPFREWWNEDETHGGWWDWYQVGGRYADRLPAGNVQRMGDARSSLVEHPPWTVIGPEMLAFREEWDGENLVPRPGEVEAVIASVSDECIAVVVDYHS